MDAWKSQFKQAMAAAYGKPFEQLDNIRDLNVILGVPPTQLPIHYPRSTREPNKDGKNFEWFIGNKRGPKLGLPLATDNDPGLPLIAKDGHIKVK